jgi:uncharacterized protein (DUF58 family)
MLSFFKRKPAPAPALPASVASPDVEQVLRRLEWTVIKRLDGVLQGDVRTWMRGVGLDLADLREYQPQDDVRHIDWNVTARMGEPYVRQYREDRDVTAWFVVDLTGSVEFGSTGKAKATLAEECIAVLARLMVKHGNRVGAVIYKAGHTHTVRARTGRMQVLTLMQALRDVRNAATPSRGTPLPKPTAPKAAPGTDLAHLFGEAGRRFTRRSAVFVVSDFIAEEAWGRALGQLAMRHEVVAVRLTDPMESQLPDLGLVQMADAETGETLLVDTHDKAFRARFAAAALARETAMEREFSASGCDALTLSTAQPMDRAILGFAQQRKRRMHGARHAAAGVGGAVGGTAQRVAA